MLGPPFTLTDEDESIARRAHRRRDTFGRVSGTAGLVLAPEARIYDHGPQHPLRPERVLLTWDLIAAYGARPRARRRATLRAEPPTTRPSCSCTRRSSSTPRARAGHGEEGPWGRFGYGPGDNPIFDRTARGGRVVVGRHRRGGRARS